MLRYTEEHEWLKQDGELLVVGITAHASEQLGDLVFIELPEAGTKVAAGDEVATIESVKAASDISAPMAGEIVAVNEAVVAEPKLVNDDPLGAGWFFKIKPEDPAAVEALMDEAAYTAMIG